MTTKRKQGVFILKNLLNRDSFLSSVIILHLRLKYYNLATLSYSQMKTIFMNKCKLKKL